MKILLALLLSAATLAAQDFTRIQMRAGVGLYNNLAIAPISSQWRYLNDTNWYSLGQDWTEVYYTTNAEGGDYFNFRSEQANTVELSTNQYTLLEVNVSWAWNSNSVPYSSNWTKSFYMSDSPPFGGFSNCISAGFGGPFEGIWQNISVTEFDSSAWNLYNRDKLPWQDEAEKAVNQVLRIFFPSTPDPP